MAVGAVAELGSANVEQASLKNKISQSRPSDVPPGQYSPKVTQHEYSMGQESSIHRQHGERYHLSVNNHNV